jgi:hypothetical protein
MKTGGKFEVGKPYLEGAAVEAEVLEELKAPKVRRGLEGGGGGGERGEARGGATPRSAA